MLEEKELVYIRQNNALTDNVQEVEIIPDNDFPKLVFQEFLKQLKLPHLKIDVSKTHQLIQEYPALLEQANEDIIFENILKQSVNKFDLINYYLICYVLKSDFCLYSVFFDNSLKSTLYFESKMPFTSKNEIEIPFIIKQLISSERPKKTEQLLERFFILSGHQFKDKLLIYLTFIEAKYKYKLDKKGFINTALHPLRLNQLNDNILNLIK